MNYVGSISILDRGDAPAQAVIDRNARSMAQRVADDTKDELEKVMTRVETIYSSFEDTEQAFGTSNLEYLQDIAELEEVMKDQVKKKKYQQQVTIFIVGFSDVSGQKLRLMQQVNEFFTENSKNMEEEDWFPSTPDLDLEEVGDKIEDSLQVARDLTQRLGDLNKEMVDYMATYAEKKASNKLGGIVVEGKGKKKMEKALLQAKDEVQGLAEKLQSAQADLAEREEKLQHTFKQLEAKNLEVQKFRTAAELAKKALQDSEGLAEALRERDVKISEQRQQLSRMEVELAQSTHLKERSQTKLTNVTGESQQRITALQKEVDQQKRFADDVKRDLSQFHDEQLTALREVHQQDMEEMKKQHAEQIKSLSTDLQRARTELAATQHSLLELQIEQGVSETQSEAGRQFDLDSEDPASRQSSKQESRPSTKGRVSGLKKGSGKLGGKEAKGGRTSASGSSLASGDLDHDLNMDDLDPHPGEDYGDVGTQDEGGDWNTGVVEEKRLTPATRHSRRSRSTLAPVEEFDDYDDVYDLDDEQAWSSVPKEQLEGRFAQYRRICQHKLRETEEQRQLTVAKTQRKVQLLKSQFVEHKTKWEAERKVLISQVEQAQQLQIDAEKEADQAMTQLEDFITEQERLEEEEETRRSAILRGASGSSSLTAPSPHTPVPPRTPHPPVTPAGAADPSTSAPAQPTPPESRSTHTSEELGNLLQQTDDAKVEELRGRLTGTKSAPPGVDMTMVAAGEGETTATGQETEDEGEGGVTREGEGEEDDRQALLENLHDLPPLTTTTTTPSLPPPPLTTTTPDRDDAASTPSLPPPPTAATAGSLPAHDQLETPLAEVEVVATGDGKDPAEAEAKEETPDAMIKVSGDVEDDLREASARSRASLRSDYKRRLEESRQAADERRARSPLIKLPANLSVDDELVLDDDDDDDDIYEEGFDKEMALPDDLKEEIEEARRKEMWREMTVTPPPSKELSSLSLQLAAGKLSKLRDHPIVGEYLKTYHCVTSFKDTLSKLFLDKDMMSASQIVSDLETMVFETDRKVMPQLEQFTNNVVFILEEISSVINSAVMVDREPPVSSLLPFSRDEARASRLPPTRQASADPLLPTLKQAATPTPTALTDPLPPAPHHEGVDSQAGEVPSGEIGGRGQEGEAAASRKSSVTAEEFAADGDGGGGVPADWESRFSYLQQKQMDDAQKYEEQIRHNTVVMMEMQDTINELQRELSAIGKAATKPRSASASLSATPSPDQSLLFTRLDLERNAKMMKKAVLDQRLDADKYKEVVTTMGDYVSLPAQRLAHLVKKYVHHSRMKEIEENVKNSESLDEGVFDTLDKMEALQNQRARQWAEKMDSMGMERLRLAAMLMDSLDSIEQESGLFLIKPMYSYRGRELKAPPTQKLARPMRSQPVPRHQSATRDSTTSFVPAPTPASNTRRLDRHTPSQQMLVDMTSLPPPPPSRPEDGVVGSGAIRSSFIPQSAPLTKQQLYQTWNMSVSQARSPVDPVQLSLNTPRMLELDINRMLIGQNNVSTKLPYPPSEDRLVNASNNTLRSYVTVQRPAATLPPSAQAGRDTSAPPTSPSPRPPVAVSPTDRDLPTAITSPPPLPPIGAERRSGSDMSSHPDDDLEPPRSPPGSSMYQSTNQDQDEGPAHNKATPTRASSQLSQLSVSDGEQL
ncbi:uncharacterized protein LOC143278152 isoform X3 [Babylonia areolata]|uniref:uncharacterized protein LOC143278152 isoform X3 n=1 Tax=Babylonia areolata TaxID=304850 RepID=UPI003FD25CEA